MEQLLEGVVSPSASLGKQCVNRVLNLGELKPFGGGSDACWLGHQLLLDIRQTFDLPSCLFALAISSTSRSIILQRCCRLEAKVRLGMVWQGRPC